MFNDSIFDYLRAVVYNLYRSVFSTGAAMVLKKISSSNKGTAAHRDTCDRHSSGLRRRTNPHILTLFFVSASVSVAGDDVLCWLLSCPFLLSAFPVFFSHRNCSGLIRFGAVYLVTAAGFLADTVNMR